LRLQLAFLCGKSQCGNPRCAANLTTENEILMPGG
jgi:hypothetical protein